LLGSPNFQLYGPLIKYTLLMAVSNAFKEVYVLHNGMSWARAQLVQHWTKGYLENIFIVELLVFSYKLP